MASLERFSCDDETGEIITYRINDETGEPSVINKVPRIFCIDRSLNSHRLDKFPGGYVSKTKKFQVLKENILAGSNTTSPRMLLIITTCLGFSSFICVILMLLETFLHIRCHKKNKKLTDPNLYYRSPFHVITSNFCGVCRETEMASKIVQMQDKRRFRYGYLRGLAI